MVKALGVLVCTSVLAGCGLVADLGDDRAPRSDASDGAGHDTAVADSADTATTDTIDSTTVDSTTIDTTADTSIETSIDDADASTDAAIDSMDTAIGDVADSVSKDTADSAAIDGSDSMTDSPTVSNVRILAFYKRATGLNLHAATVDEAGVFAGLGDTSVASDWTHVTSVGIATNGSELLFYNRSNGAASIATMDASGVAHETHHWAGSTASAFATWDQIVYAGRTVPDADYTNGRPLTVFYHWVGLSADPPEGGDGALSEMTASDPIPIRTDSNGSWGKWSTCIRGMDFRNSLLCYNAENGALDYGTFGAAPDYAFNQRWMKITVGYDLVASDGSTVVFYNSTTGNLEWGVAALPNDYVPKNSLTYATGMTHLVGLGNGEFVFYRKSDGALFTLQFGADGSHKDQHSYTTTAGWDIMTVAGER